LSHHQFVPSLIGLYYVDIQKVDFNLLQTRADNALYFSQRQIENAKKARELYMKIGTLSMADFKNIIKMNGIQNCPITIENINIAEKIWKRCKCFKRKGNTKEVNTSQT
jgi:hypothetical protein